MPALTTPMHGRTHCPGGSDPIPCMLAAPPPGDYSGTVLSYPDLRGYWRLGEGSSSPTPTPAATPTGQPTWSASPPAPP